MSRVYVSQKGSDTNNGEKETPLLSIDAATASPANNEIFILDGIYSGQINATKFDQVRRKIVGIGDVYFNAQGSSSCFTASSSCFIGGLPAGGLLNNHLFKNIKFVNYSNQAVNFSGGSQIFSSCFFLPLQTAGSAAFYVSRAASFDIRKCTFINNQSIFSLNPLMPSNAIAITNMVNSLMYGQTNHIQYGGIAFSFSTFLTASTDMGNYYDNNIHLANGGINSTVGENPPLFINAAGGNYDLQVNSTLIGAGYLGSDIGSFHDFSPFTSTSDEPVSIFDVGWQNDNNYFNIMTQLPAVGSPSNACGMILANINGLPQWVLDLATTRLGKSGRIISGIIDLLIVRTITRGSWSAQENLVALSGSRAEINNLNTIPETLEIRGDVSTFDPEIGGPIWMSFTKATAIGLTARYVELRIEFRLDGV